MLGFFLIGLFAAFGALCALWVLVGCWLMDEPDENLVLIPTPGREEAVLRRCAWLRSFGFHKGRLTMVSDRVEALSKAHPEVIFLTWAQFLARQEYQQEKRNGT